MKLGDVIKKNSVAEIKLSDGTVIAINVPESIYEIEYLDDEWQQLGFITKVTAGRRKGQKAIMVVPYTAIRSVNIVEGS